MQADGDGRNRQPRGERRREQILEAAVEVFAEQGYRAGGLAALAERVGLTPSGVLYYFGTKERLLREVVAERDRVDLPNLSDQVRLRDLRIIGAHNEETATLTRLFLVLATENLDPDDPLHDFFVERYEAVRTLWRRVLRAEQEAGRVRDDVDVDAVATEALAVIQGLELQWLMDPHRIDLAAQTSAYVDRLITSLS